MIDDRDYDDCMCGHIRAEHEGNGDGKGPCAQRVRNGVPDCVSASHYDPCPCKSFVPRTDSALCARCGGKGWFPAGSDDLPHEQYCECSAGQRRRVLDRAAEKESEER